MITTLRNSAQDAGERPMVKMCNCHATNAGPLPMSVNYAPVGALPGRQYDVRL
jgi:hypothetical protein